MRRHLVRSSSIAIGLAVTAAACGSDGAPASSAATEPSAQTNAPTSTPDPPTTTASTDEVGAAADPAAAPVFVTVDQIESDPRDESVPSALRGDRLDPRFPDALIDTTAIISGGPPPDGIPPIDAPMFQTAESVDWLADVEPVLVLDIDGEARAYPVQVMTWHEIVNDTFGDTPVTVSFCPLCNSAVAYERRVGDRVLDFGTSGELFNSSLVMYDRQTESLWSHFTGEAVVGALTGTELTLIPVTTTSWAIFSEAHPDGLVLSRETGFRRDYGRNPYVGYDDVNNSPFLFRGETDDRLLPQTKVVAVRGDTETAAVLHEDLVESGVLATEVDGAGIVALQVAGTASSLDESEIALGRDVGTTGVFLTRLDGIDVDLSRTDDGVFVDAVTGSVFDILGRAIDGTLTGQRLERIEHLDTFWFAIAAFEADTRIVQAP